MASIGTSEEAKFNPPKNSGHIHINLLPKARGKGVGSKLLKEFFKYAKSKGVKRVHADSFHFLAAAYQETDILALDLELRRGERTCAAVAQLVGGGEALAHEAGYGLRQVRAPWVGQGAMRGTGAEGVVRFPVAIGVTFKVGDDDGFGGVGANSHKG